MLLFLELFLDVRIDVYDKFVWWLDPIRAFRDNGYIPPFTILSDARFDYIESEATVDLGERLSGHADNFVPVHALILPTCQFSENERTIPQAFAGVRNRNGLANPVVAHDTRNSQSGESSFDLFPRDTANLIDYCRKLSVRRVATGCWELDA